MAATRDPTVRYRSGYSLSALAPIRRICIIVEVAEESIDRRLEVGEHRTVLIQEFDLLEKPPQTLEQPEFWGCRPTEGPVEHANFCPPNTPVLLRTVVADDVEFAMRFELDSHRRTPAASEARS
jgi:hypothetical protein